MRPSARRCIYTDLRSLLVICLLTSLQAHSDWADSGPKHVGDNLIISQFAPKATRLNKLILAFNTVSQISDKRRFDQMNINTLRAKTPESEQNELNVYKGFPFHVFNFVTRKQFSEEGELPKAAEGYKMLRMTVALQGWPDFFRLPNRNIYGQESDLNIRLATGDDAESFLASKSAKKQSPSSSHFLRTSSSSPRWQKRTPSALCSSRHVSHRWLLEFFRTGKVCQNHVVRVRFGIGR